MIERMLMRRKSSKQSNPNPCNINTTIYYRIQGKFCLCFIFAFFALRPDHKLNTWLIELFVCEKIGEWAKSRLFKLVSDLYKTWPIQSCIQYISHEKCYEASAAVVTSV